MKIRIPLVLALILIVLSNSMVFLLTRNVGNETPSFKYRDRVPFNSSPNDVRDAFGNNVDSSPDDSYLHMDYKVAGYKSTVYFLFFHSKLGVINVETEDNPDKAYEAFKNGLISIYGNTSSGHPKTFDASDNPEKTAYWIRDDVEISLQLCPEKTNYARRVELSYSATDLTEIQNQTGL